MTAAGVSTRDWLQAGLFRSALYALSLRGGAPRGLERSLVQPWRGDGVRGARILRGTFSFGGESWPIGEGSWDLPGAGEGWRAERHGFAWLADLHALGSDAARRRAREQVIGWILRHDRWDPVAWRADVLAARIVSWLAEHDFFCASADDEFRRQYFLSLGRQVRHLARIAPGRELGVTRLAVAKALVFAGVALSGAEARLGQGLHLLARELRRQIAPDGSNRERSPWAQLAALRHLIDVRVSLTAGGHAIPPYVQDAILRMAPALRFFRHGDGRLALFNGSTEEDAELIESTLAQANAPGRPPDQLPHGGFERLRAGRTLLIADVGPPSEPGLDQRAHAGTLSFEMSVGRERLIVNCGVNGSDSRAWLLAERASAAHSTLVVEDTNSSEVRGDGRIGRRPQRVWSRREEKDGGTLIDASHDGYAPGFGLVHQRLLYLGPGGDEVLGEDRLTPASDRARARPRAFAIRFHLFPDARASLVQTGNAALVRLPSGAGWRLQANGGTLGLEEGVYLGRLGEIRRTEQIVIVGRTDDGRASVRWAFKREALERRESAEVGGERPLPDAP
ncbi:MAG: heparinase II/III family protein [Alphaproteobacteria bacterium]